MQTKYCECCGAKITEYKHNLSVGLVKSLAKFTLVARNSPVVALKKVGFDNNSFNNFQKLRYFGLVERKNGGWSITEKGKSFLFNKIPISDHVITFRGKVKELSKITVFLPEIIKDPFWQRDFNNDLLNKDVDYGDKVGQINGVDSDDYRDNEENR